MEEKLAYLKEEFKENLWPKFCQWGMESKERMNCVAYTKI